MPTWSSSVSFTLALPKPEGQYYGMDCIPTWALCTNRVIGTYIEGSSPVCTNMHLYLYAVPTNSSLVGAV